MGDELRSWPALFRALNGLAAGRVFTTALGHFPAAWESPAYLRHLHGGLTWALARPEDTE